ncbi:hypothetical protein PATSB16_11890 [Pandoraea thiooxydans]|nr:hypothetical protein PATSB16_11890 [Pandoraea thiooxydans]
MQAIGLSIQTRPECDRFISSPFGMFGPRTARDIEARYTELFRKNFLSGAGQSLKGVS